MAESGGAAEAARLDELAAVTREYGAYSRKSHGIALVAFGASLLAVAALDVVTGTREARFAYLAVPAAWLLALSASRGRYQRHGVVVAQERPLSPRARRWLLGGLTMFGGLTVSWLVLWVSSARPDFGTSLGLAATAFAVCLVPALAIAVTNGRADLTTTCTFTGVTWGLVHVGIPRFAEPREDRVMHLLMVVIATLIAITAIVDGIRQHRRFLALERRLAALRSPAA